MRQALPCSLAVLALAATPARAEAPSPTPAPGTLTLQLELVLDAGAASCPGEDLLRRELARRIGYDPFAPDAAGAPAGRVRAVIARRGTGLAVTSEYVDALGLSRWTRVHAVAGTTARDCEQAMEDLAVDLQVEFPLFRRPLPAPSPVAPLPPSQPRLAPPLVTPESPPSRPRSTGQHLEIGAGAFAAAGVSPAVTLGGVVHLGVGVFPFGRDRPWLSFAVEGRADAPASSGPGGLRTSLLAGSAIACGHEDLFTGPRGVTWAVLGCMLGTVGRVHGWSQGVSRPVSLGAAYAGVGPRFGIEARLGSLAAIRVQGDVLPTVLPARLLLDDRGEAWRTADVAGNAGLAIVLFF